jgi:hypothetical protein
MRNQIESSQTVAQKSLAHSFDSSSLEEQIAFQRLQMFNDGTGGNIKNVNTAKKIEGRR